MLNLLINENMKIYLRLRTWILVLMIAAIVILAGTLIKTHEPPVAANWKTTLIAENQQLQSQAQMLSHQNGVPKSVISNIHAQIQVNAYDIQHDIAPNQPTAWNFSSLLEQQGLNTFIVVFVAIVAGDIVAAEFSSGTIKLLLTRPRTRNAILASKFLAVVLFSIVLTVASVILSLIVGMLFFGPSGMDLPIVFTNASNQVTQMPAIGYLFMFYGFNSVTMLMIVTIAFMISTIFRSSGVAIAISILTLLIGSAVVALLHSYWWDKYLLFANLDLSQYFVGTPLIQGMTLNFSIGVLVAYFIVMLALSFFIFAKRDVSLT